MRVTAAGNVGISNSSPIAKLDVVGTISASDAIQLGASTLACSTGISGSMRWGNASDTLQVCNGIGWISLSSGTTCGGGDASVAGNDTEIQFNDGGSALGADAELTWNKTTNKLTVTGDIEYTGVIRDTSDRRLKKEIAALPANMLDKIMLMKPVSFHMKGKDRGKELGFIAQDIEELFPELVDTHGGGDGPRSLNYIGMIAPIVKGMQELSEKLSDETLAREARESIYVKELGVLKAANDNLRHELDELRGEVRAMKRAGGR